MQRSNAEEQAKARLVRVRDGLLSDLLLAINDLREAGLDVHLAYVLGHVVPGSEVESWIVFLRDPSSGDVVGYMVGSTLGGTAVVDSRYDVTERDIDDVLTGVLNAVYTFTVVCLGHVSRLLSEKSDQRWLEHGKPVRRALLKAGRRLARHSPVILPEISRKVEELLDKVGVWRKVHVVYEVKAPRELMEYAVQGDVYAYASLEADDEKIHVRVSNDPNGGKKLWLHLKSSDAQRRWMPALDTIVDAVLQELRCTETECYAGVEAVVDWSVSFAYALALVPRPPSMVERHMSVGARWWEAAARAIEPELATMEQRLASLTSEGASKLEVERTAATVNLLRLWLTLTKHGDWRTASAEPAQNHTE
ncbi:MAG: hypothetical protein QXM08_00955 [Thermofilaceae archaeon]